MLGKKRDSMENTNNPKFNENKGRIAEFATPESRIKGARACHRAIQKKKTMSESLRYIMSLEIDPGHAKEIISNFPELSQNEIDGFTELAVLLRLYARKDAKVAIKLMELLLDRNPVGDSFGQPITITVANEEDKKLLEGI